MMRRLFGILVLAVSCFRLVPAGAGEIRAVWDHSGRGLYPGDWPKTMACLKRGNVTDLFLNVGGVDFAHYASGFLPKSQAYKASGDQLAACLRAAKSAGIRVHSWFICFNATRNAPAVLENFRRRGWRLTDGKGGLTTYLNPSLPAVRDYVLAALDELACYPVAGVHLDFVRWGDAAKKPADAAPVITQFVAEARRHVRRPKILSAAVYGKHPACVTSVGQDWPRWLSFDIVDYVVPMDYTSSFAKYAELLGAQRVPSVHTRRTIIGIGVTSNESKLNAQEVGRQIALARQCGFAGQALFKLDERLAQTIIPAVWKTDVR